MTPTSARALPAFALAAFAATGSPAESIRDPGAAAPLADPTADSIYMPNTSQELVRLVRKCEEPACMSYVYGVISGASVISAIADRPSPFCAPDYVTGADIRDAIVATIDATPQLSDLPAAFAILSTFAQNWPCLSQDEIQALQDGDLKPVDPVLLDRLLAHGGLGHALGDPSQTSRRLIVFHDQNCGYCRRFTAEAQRLADSGWRIEFYPVAIAAEESAGYGAVEIALAATRPEAARMLHEADNVGGVYDIEVALRLAQRAGVSTTAVLEAVSRTDATTLVKINTEIFFDLGARGTPAMILGYNLYSGFIGHAAIQDLFDTFDFEE